MNQPEIITLQWDELMSDPLLSLARLKDRALRCRIVSLRSVYWRIFLGQLPPPAPPKPERAEPNLVSWSIALETSRLEWECARQKFLRAPDGKWIEDSVERLSPTSTLASSWIATTSGPVNKSVNDVRVNNPLSQDKANPWNVWFNDLEMRRTIRQDVVRTFPDVAYFRSNETQNMLTNILHVYSKVHDDVGYRQGMHEVLAVIIKTLDTDSLDTGLSSTFKPSLMHQVLSRSHLEHDSYTFFSRLMRKASDWYDFNCTVPTRDTITSPSSTPILSIGFLPPQIAVTQQSPIQDSSKLVPPIVDKCWEIFHIHLRSVDPQLWAHLNELEIEPQIWGIRWLRLLFTREFSYCESLMLWDAILAEDAFSLRLADSICLVMLLRIRDSLLDSDYGSALQTILKYPRPTDGDGKIELLIYHALLLSHHPSPETAALIHQQNLDTGAIAGILPGTREPETSSKHQIKSPASYMNHRAWIRDREPFPESHSGPLSIFGSNHLGTKNHAPDSQSLVGDLAKGVYDKAESYGINKTIFGAFSDFRRNYSTSQHSNASTSASSFRHLQTKSDASQHLDCTASEKTHLLEELKANHLANQNIAKAIAICVSSLEHAMQTVRPEDLDPGEALSLGALRHIRDVMSTGISSGFDYSVMNPLIDFQASGVFTSTSLVSVGSGSSSSDSVLRQSGTPSAIVTPSASGSPLTQLSQSAPILSPTQGPEAFSSSNAFAPQSINPAKSSSSLSARFLQSKPEHSSPLSDESTLTHIPLRRLKLSCSTSPFPEPITANGESLWADGEYQQSGGNKNESNSKKEQLPSIARLSQLQQHRLGLGHANMHQSLQLRISKSQNSASDGPDPLGALALATP